MAVTVFQMSQISMTMVEGRVVKWLKQEQEPIQEGEGLVEIETDKIVVETTSPETNTWSPRSTSSFQRARLSSPTSARLTMA